MKKKLLSLMMLATLAACGGGGGDGGGGDGGGQPAKPNADGTEQNLTSQKGAVISRFNACPMAIASSSPAAASCLAGTYSGIDIFTGDQCTVKIDATGMTEATRGNVNIQLASPGTTSSFNKIAYSPIDGTSPLGYHIMWAYGRNEANASHKFVNLNFNVQHDERLTIEVKHEYPLTNESTVISCGIEL